MSTESAKQTVMAAWQAFSIRDAQVVAAVFAIDAEWIAPPNNATAVALQGEHHMRGRERIARFIASEYHTLFRNTRLDFRHVYADGNTVIVEEHMEATLVNGGSYENDYCFIFELESGLIKTVREYMDTQRGKEMIFREAMRG
jgi:ketosteroid isomerase-like protein